ncbi:AraC family transcriptional regulator [Salinicoccus hispanicus]|uniref:AraC family transcriptional regulator n=1 Tax=Salinicoccus hispanicus TaxID=157225 RepID=A0A6N8TW16_9STAP|nr:AraC family transcriptional regulator [Salinicoccus hispanicus]MXQ50104.1 AraC family transcriptional regulator [Salinicoccus hispanicus]
MENPLWQSKEELLSLLVYSDDSRDYPIIKVTSHLENFISVAVADMNGYQGVVIIGPMIDSRLTDEMLELLMTDLKVPKDKQDEVLNYYLTLSYKSNMEVIYIGLQLYFTIYNKKLDPGAVIEKNSPVDLKFVEIENPNISISKRRQEVRMHHDLLDEKKALQFIIEGEKEKVITYWRSQGESGELGLLATESQLRNLKNLGITIVTLATRAAMEGGINHEVAYTLSDLYIQNIEQLQSINEVENFIEYVLGDFAERVKKNKQLNHSRPVNHCLNYIFEHLYDEINLTRLSEASGVHPNYLSSIFRKEVGTTIREYILKSKIEESKLLIQFTDYSLLKISTLMNFYDQSYFTKTFKKYTGMTPNQYKNNLR